MGAEKLPFRVTASRFVHTVKDFASSEVGWKAILIFAGLVVLLFGANGLNVVNSYVGRNFMTSIADRDKAEFVRQAFFYIGVFAASTVVAVIARFVEERLGLLWREFLTRKAVSIYLADRAYFRLEASGKLAHVDERIAEDVRTFTVTTLSFVLMSLNSSFAILAFSGVLWAISPLLFIVAVLYAACGSLLTIALGRPLINLNSDQLDKEASFRAGLIHVQVNAEAILLGGREGQQTERLLNQLDALVANFRKITGVNLKVGFLTTGYNWLIQIIPVLIVAPAFMNGTVEFGVITQSAMAFSTLVAAFSLIVTQYQSLSNFAAVVGRLSALMDTMEDMQTTTGTGIEIVQAERRLAYERLTLLPSTNGTPLLKDLSISIPSGTCVLIRGSTQAAGVALFKATAGCSIPGAGRIIRPRADEIFFLAQRPYSPPGTLRQLLEGHLHAGAIIDDQLLGLLRELDLEHVLAKAGGLDTERDWQALLSLREQQLFALVRILLAAPQFAFLDQVGAELDSNSAQKILSLLKERSITYINIGEASEPADRYDAVLECADDGGWTLTTTTSGRIATTSFEGNENSGKGPS